jgi:hypothetical protein
VIAVTLLTARDCHLCAHGREVLEGLAAEGLIDWHEVDAGSAEGRSLAATAPPLRPVLYDPRGRVLAYGRLSARRLRRQLSGAAVDGSRSGSALLSRQR